MAKPSCQPFKMSTHFEEGFRSFNAFNVGSVGQRAAKLLAVKIGGPKEKSATWPQPRFDSDWVQTILKV